MMRVWPFNRTESKVERKSVSVTPELLVAMMSEAVEGGMARSYAGYAKDGYCGNPDVYACVREIAMGCAGIPIILQRKTRSGQAEPIDKHPLVDLMARPNPDTSGSRFIESLISYLLLAGTAYVYRAAPNSRTPLYQELFLLRPDRVAVKTGSDTLITGYIYTTADHKQVTYTTEEVLQIPFFHPTDDNYGLSPMQAAARSTDIGNEGRKWNWGLLRNSGRPPGFFSADGELSDEQFERLRALINERYSGAANAGRPGVLENGMKWLGTGLAPGEMEWQGSQRMSTLDICRVFNVPPEIVGDSQNKTYSNYQEARQALYVETILPLLDLVLGELTYWLAAPYGADLALGYRRDQIEALQEDQNKLYQRLNGAWWLTVNERRQAVGFDALPGDEHDTLYMPATLMPISMASQPRLPTLPVPGDKGLRQKALPPMNDAETRFAQAMAEVLSRQTAEVVAKVRRAELLARLDHA